MSLVEDHHETNGVSPGGKRDKAEVGGAGLCTKLVFGVLFLAFALTTTLFLVDYEQGQLAQLTSTLPPEVQQLAKKVDVAVAALTDNIKKVAAQALIKAEELSKKVPLGGDKTLADILFNSKEKEAKEAAAKKAAADKIAAEKAAAQKAAAQKAAAEKAAAQKVAADKAAAEAAAAEAARIATEEAAAAEAAIIAA